MTAAVTTGSLPGVGEIPKVQKRRLPVLPVAALLEAQHTLTAVERFAEKHDGCALPRQEKYYRDLIPLERPRSGEQYAFQVDLDACTGCKACVSACHTLNGLDEHEVWRTVGLLHGGTPTAPALQTLTTACHHCIEPACMHGCPTRAYEKDPITGIVKHLDDQCFGCEYCTLMCPYDAPKYNQARGIVRKCDMCSDRLAHGEAPACVQACPNRAISIQVVEKALVIEACDAQTFVKGAASPEHTLPTTLYKTKKVMPGNMLAADFYRTRPEDSHPPLVVMLTLTQLSVGAFVITLLIDRFSGGAAGNPLVQTAFAIALAVVALAASVFHLGRPKLAWRAFLGFRRSWLSREAIAFALFALFATSYGVVEALPHPSAQAGNASFVRVAPFLQNAAAFAGLLGVFCSVMVYVATRRELWSGTYTGLKFFGTTLLLGAAMVLAVGSWTSGYTQSSVQVSRALVFVVVAVNAIKVMRDLTLLLHFRDTRLSTEKRMALVMLGDLRTATNLRFALAGAGGLVVPALVWQTGFEGRAASTIMLVLLLAAELVERYLFFRAAPASRMPGGIR